MRAAASMQALDLLVALKGMELNGRYKLDRFAHPQVRDVKWDKKGCEMVLGKGNPHWKGADPEYCYEVFLLTLGTEDGLVSARSEWMKKEDMNGEIPFTFMVPEKVDYYAVCLYFMTGKNGKATGMRANMGMRIVEVGNGNGEVK